MQPRIQPRRKFTNRKIQQAQLLTLIFIGPRRGLFLWIFQRRTKSESNLKKFPRWLDKIRWVVREQQSTEV
jgi:hypothetical protein